MLRLMLSEREDLAVIRAIEQVRAKYHACPKELLVRQIHRSEWWVRNAIDDMQNRGLVDFSKGVAGSLHVTGLGRKLDALAHAAAEMEQTPVNEPPDPAPPSGGDGLPTSPPDTGTAPDPGEHDDGWCERCDRQLNGAAGLLTHRRMKHPDHPDVPPSAAAKKAASRRGKTRRGSRRGARA